MVEFADLFESEPAEEFQKKAKVGIRIQLLFARPL